MFQLWLVSALSVASLLLDSAFALNPSHGRFSKQTHERKARATRELERRNAELGARQNSNATFRFYNSNTAPYLIESLPDVPYELGEIYSGNIPIDMNDTSRQLFFVFQPTIGAPVDEITVWMNGGPGCSSLEGFFQEMGRWLWLPGTLTPTENPYSWVNLTNMLWVEQPIGTGFTIGTPTAQSQEETAQDFIKAFKNFQDIFGIKKFNIYVTGESYAGRYVPYVSAAMLDAQDNDYYDLRGALVYDPCIGQFDYVQQEAPAVPYVLENNNLFNFNASFIEQLKQLHQSCGYADYIEQYLQFPASGVQPPKFNSTSEASCDVFDMIYHAALDLNPCFDIYEINQQCPLLWDVLSFPTTLVYNPGGSTTYFDRPDVKAAMHAPNVTWSICNSGVFVGNGTGPEQEGDISANPIEHVLPQVIEATNRVLVSNADYDMILITNGTLMAIQNMTWNGKLGFEEMPSTSIDITTPDLLYADVYAANNMTGDDGPQGIMGIQHFERGLMWAETFQAGHMQPEFQPRVAYRHLEWLLGRTETI